MKDSLKRLSVKYGGIAAIIYAIGFAPVPLTTGNITAARWTINLYRDLVDNIDEVRLSGIERDVQILKEIRTDSKLQDYRFQMILYEMQVDRLGKSNSPDDMKKMERLERRIDRLYDKIDEDGIKRQDIRSTTDRQYLVLQ